MNAATELARYRVIDATNRYSIVLSTDSFKEACEKYIEILCRSMDAECSEERFRNCFIEKLGKGTHIYVPV